MFLRIKWPLKLCRRFFNDIDQFQGNELSYHAICRSFYIELSALIMQNVFLSNSLSFNDRYRYYNSWNLSFRRIILNCGIKSTIWARLIAHVRIISDFSSFIKYERLETSLFLLISFK